MVLGLDVLVHCKFGLWRASNIANVIHLGGNTLMKKLMTLLFSFMLVFSLAMPVFAQGTDATPAPKAEKKAKKEKKAKVKKAKKSKKSSKMDADSTK